MDEFGRHQTTVAIRVMAAQYLAERPASDPTRKCRYLPAESERRVLIGRWAGTWRYSSAPSARGSGARRPPEYGTTAASVSPALLGRQLLAGHPHGLVQCSRTAAPVMGRTLGSPIRRGRGRVVIGTVAGRSL